MYIGYRRYRLEFSQLSRRPARSKFLVRPANMSPSSVSSLKRARTAAGVLTLLLLHAVSADTAALESADAAAVDATTADIEEATAASPPLPEFPPMISYLRYWGSMQLSTMNEKEKKRFHEVADKDKFRYDTKMQSYIPPKGEKVHGKKWEQIKDPYAPKRSLSVFFWFCNDERGKVWALNPEYYLGDVATELGKMWSNADITVKQKYEAIAEKDKARYEREMTEYKNEGKPTLLQ